MVAEALKLEPPREGSCPPLFFPEDDEDEEEEEEGEDDEEGEEEEDLLDLLAGPVTTELSLVLCDDTSIRTLNKQYRRKNYATDVLSFPQVCDGLVPLVPASFPVR